MNENGLIQKGTRKYYQAMAALFLGSLTTFGVEYCVQPIIPVFSQTFGLSPASASLAVSCGTGGMAISMLFIAMWAQRFNRRLTMLVGLSVASLLALLISFCYQFEYILAARLMQGVLLAGFPSMAIAYINEEFDKSITGTVIGIYVSGNSIGGLAGRIILSTLTDIWDWRTALLFIGVIYFIMCVLCFMLLPKGTHHVPGKRCVSFLTEFNRILHNRNLMSAFMVATCAMGAFVCSYNFMSYVLLAPPYSLSQTVVGFMYCLFLVGTFASTVMGILSDKIGNGRVIIVSLLIMLAGVAVSLLSPLACKIAGLGIITYGFFGAHSAACSWVGKLDKADKAELSAFYMLFYYAGASVVGSLGGVFLKSSGWGGVCLFLTIILFIGLGIAIPLYRRVAIAKAK